MFILEGIWPRNLVTTWLLQFLSFLDRIAFSLFTWVLQVIFDIANSEIVRDGFFDSFRTRIYVLLGIFMLFKITISLLGYLVNPDSLADKEKGMGKMISRTIIVILMLIGCPFAFNLLDEIQEPLLEALPRIVIGQNSSEETMANQMTGVADSVAWTVFQISLGEDTPALMCPDASNTSTCINTVEGATSVITDPADGNKAEFKYYYIPVVGFIIAIVMTVLLVGIAIDVAIRVFKLVILQLIAPIPIISYIDPKSAKDGAFSSWVKLTISTWVDLFLKLGILYFVLFLIDELIIRKQLVLASNLPFIRRTVVIIFLIIGLLFFARQAPKFVSKALGIKEGGGMGVGLGGILAGAGALVGGAGLAGALSASTQAMNENADAAAQGKAGTASWSKGSDLAAQLRTGDSKAKGGLTQSFQRKAQKMQGEARARKLGLTEDNVKFGKDQMISAQRNASLASQAYSAAVSGRFNKVGNTYFDAFGNALNARNDEDAIKELSDIAADASAYSQKVSSDYQSASAARDALVGKDAPFQKYVASRRVFNQEEKGRANRQRDILTYNANPSHSGHKQIDPNLENSKGDYDKNKQNYNPKDL